MALKEKVGRYTQLLQKAGGRTVLKEFEVMPVLTLEERVEFFKLRKILLLKKAVER